MGARAAKAMLPCAATLPSSTSSSYSHSCWASSSLRTQLAFLLARPHSTAIRGSRPLPAMVGPDGSPTTGAIDTFSMAPASAIDFLSLCERLKTTKRAGWINHGLQNTESIADHMYRMAIMALIAPDTKGINRDRCVKMAIVHDLAEAIVGDITPSDGVPKEEKSRREKSALKEMCDILGDGFAAEEVKELWDEYEANASMEAKLVKDFDKVEMILQATEYENAQGKTLDDFFMSTAGKFQTDLGKAWAAEVVARRSRKKPSK